MRDFNNREKEIIQELVLLDEKYSGNFSGFIRKYMYPLSDKSALYFDLWNGNLYLLIEGKRDYDDPKVTKMYNRFYEFLSLIIYLKDSRFISIFKTPPVPDVEYFIILGEQFSESDGVSIHGYYATMPPERPEDWYSGPEGGKEKKTTHYSYELGKGMFQIASPLFRNKVFVSEDLKQLVKRDFRSIESIRHRKQQIVAWIGVGIAFITLIVTLTTLILI